MASGRESSELSPFRVFNSWMFLKAVLESSLSDQVKVVVVFLGLVAVHIQSDALLDQDIHCLAEVVHLHHVHLA